jgi:hypothetical protein
MRSPVLPRYERQVVVRPVETNNELEAVAALSDLAYSQAALPRATRAAWWETFPLGLWVAVDDSNRVLGTMGVWPLPRTVAEQFSAGRRAERDLPANGFVACQDEPTDCWYVSGVTVRPEYRRTHLVRVLVTDSLHGWMRRCVLRFPLRCLALAQSLEGLRLLQRCGFRLVRDKDLMPDGFPLYALELQAWPDLRSLLIRRGLLVADPCLSTSIWIPGEPGLAEYKRAREDYAELIRAWCNEEGLPERSMVALCIHNTHPTPPSAARIAQVVAEAARVIVQAVEVVRDGRDGLEIRWLGDAPDGAVTPPAHEQVALFDAEAGER